eukprot:754652-Hanusia_phi.AAC.1
MIDLERLQRRQADEGEGRGFSEGEGGRLRGNLVDRHVHVRGESALARWKNSENFISYFEISAACRSIHDDAGEVEANSPSLHSAPPQVARTVRQLVPYKKLGVDGIDSSADDAAEEVLLPYAHVELLSGQLDPLFSFHAVDDGRNFHFGNVELRHGDGRESETSCGRRRGGVPVSTTLKAALHNGSVGSACRVGHKPDHGERWRGEKNEACEAKRGRGVKGRRRQRGHEQDEFGELCQKRSTCKCQQRGKGLWGRGADAMSAERQRIKLQVRSVEQELESFKKREEAYGEYSSNFEQGERAGRAGRGRRAGEESREGECRKGQHY